VVRVRESDEPLTTPSRSPAAFAPFGEFRLFGAQRGVVAVARVDPGVLGQRVEKPFRDVVQQRREQFR